MNRYLRIDSREARKSIANSRRLRLRNSLMNNQGLSKETAKELAREAVPVRKAKA